MPYQQVVQKLRQKGLAAIRFEKEGNSRFRDCVTICRGGKLLFERYCYGEAASLVFCLWAKTVLADGTVEWNYAATEYSQKYEAPTRITGKEGDALLFDEKPALWQPAREYKTYPKAGLNGPVMLLRNLFKK